MEHIDLRNTETLEFEVTMSTSLYHNTLMFLIVLLLCHGAGVSAVRHNLRVPPAVQSLNKSRNTSVDMVPGIWERECKMDNGGRRALRDC